MNFLFVIKFKGVSLNSQQTNMSYKLIIIDKSHVALIYFRNKLISITMEHNLYKINDIYLGKVSKILPSLDAAFINLNNESNNGFISFDQLKDKNHGNIRLDKNILVQITREPIGSKGPNVSPEIKLIGKYLILLPFSKFIYTSKKNYPDNTKNKEYSKALGYLLINPKHLGLFIKSESLEANIDFLIKEIKILKSRWTEIITKSCNTFTPSLLSRKKKFINKIFEEYSNIRFEFISTDSYEAAVRVKKILCKIGSLDIKTNLTIEFHKTSLDLIRYYLIDVVITEIMKPRVSLPKGGYIVIEKTEALTSVDVNSGSFTSLDTPQQTSLWVNYSAVSEIIKQIKLRNIGGIIIIDFIDSSNQRDQMKLLRYMNKLIKKDYRKCTIIQMSELGLVEITRTRYGQSVYDAFSRKCNVCNGLGYLSTNLNKVKNVFYELNLNIIPPFYVEDRIAKIYNN